MEETSETEFGLRQRAVVCHNPEAQDSVKFFVYFVVPVQLVRKVRYGMQETKQFETVQLQLRRLSETGGLLRVPPIPSGDARASCLLFPG